MKEFKYVWNIGLIITLMIIILPIVAFISTDKELSDDTWTQVPVREPYVDHGAQSLIRADRCYTIVVWWGVLEKGVASAGPSPASLVDPIPVALLRREILATIND
jgi:hypothetical protein